MANVQAQTNIDDTSQSVIIKLIKFFFILIVIAASVAYIYYYYFAVRTTDNNNIYLSINLAYFPLVAGISTILIMLRAISSPPGANSRKAYWGLTLAVLFYFLGEFTYYVRYYSTNGNVLNPGFADIFWVIGTIFFIDELFFMASVIKVHFTKKQLLAICGITAIIVVGLILFAFGSVITEGYSIDNTPYMKALNLFYFTSDILILFATLYVSFGLFTKTGFKLSRRHLAWIFLILGNISQIIGDTVYAYFTQFGNNLVVNILSFHFVYYYTNFNLGYSPDELMYMLQYMFWAFSFAMFPSFLNRSFSTSAANEFIPLENKPEKKKTQKEDDKQSNTVQYNVLSVGKDSPQKMNSEEDSNKPDSDDSIRDTKEESNTPQRIE